MRAKSLVIALQDCTRIDLHPRFRQNPGFFGFFSVFLSSSESYSELEKATRSCGRERE